MDPVSHRVALSPEPPGLLDSLRPILAAQGTPELTVHRVDGALEFACATGEFMLRARVAAALGEACPDWRRRSSTAPGVL
jgi:hypothetical protein